MHIKEILLKPSVAALLIIACPLLTYFWVYTFRIPESELSHSTLKKIISYLTLTSVIISCIAHILLSFKKGLIWSGAISEVIYQTLFVIYALSDPVHWAENFMWLPLMMISVAALTLPMVLSTAYGCGVIINAMRSKKTI